MSYQIEAGLNLVKQLVSQELNKVKISDNEYKKGLLQQMFV